MREIIVEPGQRIVTTGGEVATVALTLHGRVYVHAIGGWIKAVDIVGDAFGGEHDQTKGLAA